ncbi:Eco57I restriction-modification methylase domain-containing protein [Halocatena halophila]|uniref:Eco57I restriction-modification methylase domain-containing protein n=1 Tax=Halocatena halophila TaxID=2814576 RepID=UPI002ED03D94
MAGQSYRTGGALFSSVFLERTIPLTDQGSTWSLGDVDRAMETLIAHWDVPVDSIDPELAQSMDWIELVVDTITDSNRMELRPVQSDHSTTDAPDDTTVKILIERAGGIADGNCSAGIGTRLVSAFDCEHVEWAIVTDGVRWRLYHDKTPAPFEQYHEIDLLKLLAVENPERFAEFCLLFDPPATRSGENSVHETLTTEHDRWCTSQYAALTANVRTAITTIANDVVEHPPTPEMELDTQSVLEGAVVLCLRLLVVRIADVASPLDPIANSKARDGTVATAESESTGTDIRSTLESLFRRFNGDGEHSELGTYPGWLFDCTDDRATVYDGVNLLTHCSSETLTRVCSLLTTRETPDGEEILIDYGVFSPRQLGMLYETVLGCALEHSTHSSDSTIESFVLADNDQTRKETGSYYTPERIVGSIVDSTLDDLCEAGTESDRSTETGVCPLAVNLLDLAMGCGHFLLGGADRLLVRTLTEVDESRSLGSLREELVSQCLYGVDRDPLAVEVSRAALWLWSLPGDGGKSIDVNCTTGNALLGSTDHETFEESTNLDRHRQIANVEIARSAGVAMPEDAIEALKAAISTDERWETHTRTDWFQRSQEFATEQQVFHWPLAFPSVTEFDAVVTNPPYLRSRSMDRTEKRAYSAHYTTAEGLYDSYGLFIERAATLGRCCSMIVPNKWTTTDYGESLRRLLLETCSLERITDVSNLDIFPDASIYPVIVKYTSDGPTTAVTVERRAPRTTVTIDRSTIQSVAQSVIPIHLSASFIPVLTAVQSIEQTLADHLTIYEGIHTGNARSTLVVDDRVDETCEPLVDGESLGRYLANWNGQWIRYDRLLLGEEEYATLRDAASFDRENKLLIRDISYRPTAAIDESGLFPLNTLYCGIRTSDSAPSLAYLLGVFNSTFMAVYYRQLYGGTHVGGEYLRFKPMFTEELPIPPPDSTTIGANQQDELAEILPGAVPDTAGGCVELLVERVRQVIDEQDALAIDPTPMLEAAVLTPLESLDGFAFRVTDESSLFQQTADTVEGLRIGSVDCVTTGQTVGLTCTLRYKPERERADTDRWGYVETEPEPVAELTTQSGATRRVVRRVIEYAVEHGKGTAGFRRCATKTLSPADRLGEITVPTCNSQACTAFHNRLKRYETLTREIETIESLIDELVYDLYGLSSSQRSVIDSLSDYSAESSPDSGSL